MNDDTLLDAVEIEPREPATHAVIWLHGLGADGHDFEPIVPELGLDPAHRVRFVFPHAPHIPVTLNMGMVMPAWYDIEDGDLGKRHDEAGIRATAARIEALIEREKSRGVAAERLLLAGFSQGGAMALHVALRHPEPLAGVLALSTYMVLEDTIEDEASAAGRAHTCFMAHGQHDPMVPITRGRAAHESLARLGWQLEWRDYPMMHQVCMEEIAAVGGWLKERVRDSAV